MITKFFTHRTFWLPVFFLTACKTLLPSNDKLTGIYGEDDRRDFFETQSNPVPRKIADAIAMRVLVSGTAAEPNGMVDLKPVTLQQLYKTCEDERFASQQVAGSCSGFLIGSDLIATAGHCVKSIEFCQKYIWVFGYMLERKDQDLSRAHADNVYRCTEVKSLSVRKPGIDFLDYAVIKLDRPVTGREPIAVPDHEFNVGEKVIMMGHPLGLPLKITGDDQTIIREAEQDKAGHKFWSTNLDSYEGNSGSPVFRASDWSLIGITTSGDEDFESESGCSKSIHRRSSSGRGERVVPTSYFKPRS